MSSQIKASEIASEKYDIDKIKKISRFREKICELEKIF